MGPAAGAGPKRLLVVNWLMSMCWDVHTFAVPLLGHERGFSASTIGLILGAFTLVGDGGAGRDPAAGAPAARGTVVRAAMISTGVVFALYPLAPTPGSWACVRCCWASRWAACNRW